MPRIATTDELMGYLDIGGNNPARVNHVVLNSILESAESFAETHARRLFAPLDAADTPSTRTFPVRGTGRIRLPDLRSATSVTLNGNAIVADQDYEFPSYIGDEPITSIKLISWSPYTAFSRTGTLAITGLWGFSPTPPDVKHAVLTIAARAYRKRDAAFSDQVDTGTGAFDYRGSFPREAIDILDQYRIPNVAVV